MQNFASRVCEREREIDRVTSHHISYLCVCVCVREKKRERGGHITAECTVVNANTYEHFRARTDGKTKDIINCLYYNLES